MPGMPREPKDKLRRDVNETAFDTVRAAMGEADKPRPPGSREKNPEAVRRGRKGGKKGGGGRARKLSPKRRKDIARKAALKRWAKRR